MKRFLDNLDGRPVAFKFGLCMAILGLVALIDYVTGVELSVAAFYPVPVVLTAWFTRRWEFVGMAAGAAATQLAIRIAEDPLARFRPLLLWNTSMEFVVFASLGLAIAALRSAFDRESTLARTDPLTGAANRRAFFERGELEFRRARRDANAPLSLAFFDLDDFKAVNDRFGHEAGDAVLIAVAATIRDRIRGTDLFARLGGDEFGLLLVGADQARALAVVDELREEVQERLRELPGNVTVSIGAVSLTSEFGSFDELLREVDRRMYAAKRREDGSI